MEQTIRRFVLIFHEAAVSETGIDLPKEEPIKISEIVADEFDTLAGVLPWGGILEIDPEAELGRLYPMPGALDELVQRARRRANELRNAGIDVEYDPPEPSTMYYRIQIQTDRGQDDLEDLLQQFVDGGQEQLIHEAYLEPMATFPPFVATAVAYTRNPFATHQEHLRPAPWGIDAQEAWRRFPVAAAGRDVAFIEIEQGWRLTHEDLDGIPRLWGTNKDVVEVNGFRVPVRDHGTAMLGLVKATDNDLGCVGIAPGCMAFAVSEWSTEDVRDTHQAVWWAIMELLTLDPAISSGSVILIEAQREYGGKNLPIEANDSALRFLLLTAALNDVIIIEPAGNGSSSIDAYLLADSQAIIVGAGKPVEDPFLGREWGRWEKSNYGNGVHCFARGDVITSLSSEDPWYVCRTGGTSAAAAIVAGAAIVLQAVMKSQGKTLSPLELRTIFALSALGTSTATIAELIGVMPDLGSILKEQEDVLNGTSALPGNGAGILNPGRRGHIPLRGDAEYQDYLNDREGLRAWARETLDEIRGSGPTTSDGAAVPLSDRSPYVTSVG